MEICRWNITEQMKLRILLQSITLVFHHSETEVLLILIISFLLHVVLFALLLIHRVMQ